MLIYYHISDIMSILKFYLPTSAASGLRPNPPPPENPPPEPDPEEYAEDIDELIALVKLELKSV